MKLLPICVLGLLCPAAGPAEGQPLDAGAWLDSLKPLVLFVLEHPEATTPKELTEMKRDRNRYQREGYVRALRDLVAGDAAGALLAYVKLSLHIELSMKHKEFWIVSPDSRSGRPGIPFPDDWSYPADPWKREWWSVR